MLKQLLAAVLIVPIVLFSTTHTVTPGQLEKPAIEVKSEKELNCLAENIYHEAKNQSRAGKMGVAFVTMNRSNSPKYPQNVCKVVYQKSGGVCQFSWVCGERSIKDTFAYDESKRIAKLVMTRYNELIDPTEGALFFHAHYVNPGWNKSFIKTVRIDDHIFYKPRKLG